MLMRGLVQPFFALGGRYMISLILCTRPAKHEATVHAALTMYCTVLRTILRRSHRPLSPLLFLRL